MIIVILELNSFYYTYNDNILSISYITRSSMSLNSSKNDQNDNKREYLNFQNNALKHQHKNKHITMLTFVTIRTLVTVVIF